MIAPPHAPTLAACGSSRVTASAPAAAAAINRKSAIVQTIATPNAASPWTPWRRTKALCGPRLAQMVAPSTIPWSSGTRSEPPGAELPPSFAQIFHTEASAGYRPSPCGDLERPFPRTWCSLVPVSLVSDIWSIRFLKSKLLPTRTVVSAPQAMCNWPDLELRFYVGSGPMNRTSSSGTTEPRARRASRRPAACAPVVPVHIERDGDELLHRQVYRELVQLIRSGCLRPAVRLPSSRVLAEELGVARNTVLLALEQLTSEGYVETRPARGAYVCVELPDRPPLWLDPPTRSPGRPPELAQRAQSLVAPANRPVTTAGLLRPGEPDFAGFPFNLWARLLWESWRRPQRPVSCWVRMQPAISPCEWRSPTTLPLRAASRVQPIRSSSSPGSVRR